MMLSKYAFIIAALFLMTLKPICLNAQLLMGLETGISYNHLKTNISNETSTLNKSKIGYSFGARVEYKLAKKISLIVDPNWVQKNYSEQRIDSFAGIYQNHINDYAQVPIAVSFYFGGRKFQGFFLGGVYGGYWVHGKLKGRIPNLLNSSDSASSNGQSTDYLQLTAYNVNYSFDSRRDNRFEFGYLAGAGVKFLQTEHCTFFTELIYNRSLTDQQKKYMIIQDARYNQTYQFSLGVLIKLPV
jgi:Outer membrane protein beta-barrel domain